MGSSCSDCIQNFRQEEKRHQEQITGKVVLKINNKKRLYTASQGRGQNDLNASNDNSNDQQLLKPKAYTSTSYDINLIPVERPVIKATESIERDIESYSLNGSHQLPIAIEGRDINKKIANNRNIDNSHINININNQQQVHQNPQTSTVQHNKHNKPSEDTITGKYLSHQTLQQKLFKTINSKQIKQTQSFMLSLSSNNNHQDNQNLKNTNLKLLDIEDIDILQSRQPIKS